MNLVTAPTSVETYLDCATFRMVAIAGGSFLFQDKLEVQIAPFELGQYPVTQELWELVMGENPARFHGKDHPVETISWEDAQAMIRRLNQRPTIREKNNLDGKQFRLPSETQWEYAAKGGRHREKFPFAGSYRLEEVGWYRKNSQEGTKPIGLKFPNRLGLYDMSGNVWEWCADYWQSSYESIPTDGSAWIVGGNEAGRVVRGGSWYDFDDYCRVSHRNSDYNGPLGAGSRDYYNGFRLARY